MAKRKTQEHNLAITMRLEGKSYSEIMKEVKVSKSSLSLWLKDYPLSPQKIRALRDINPRRIESFRNTMARKRDLRFLLSYKKAEKRIGRLSHREFFITGLFLYWGEGSKSCRSTVSLSNTDPSMIRFFLKWLGNLGINITKVSIVLHLYSDMNKEEEILFWMRELALPASCFKKVYIKDSPLSGLSYKNGFGHGTCMVRCYNTELHTLIMSALKYIRNL